MVFSRSAIRLGLAAVLLLSAGCIYAQTSRLRYIDAPAGDGGSGYGTGNRTQGQGYLGIMFHDVNDGEIGPMHLKDGHGAEIIMVDHDGPAGKAGLREHDVVLSVNGVTVEGEDQLRKMLHDLAPGRSVSLYICRNGAEQTVNAVMANREEVERQAWQQHWTVPSPSQDPAPDNSAVVAPSEPSASRSGFGHGFMGGHLLLPSPVYTGATVDTMGSQLADYFGVRDGKGLLVHEVETNSPAALAGLRAGDVITRMNGNHVATEKDWTRALHESKGHPVSITVVRDRKEQVLTMTPDAKKRSAVEEPSAPEPGIPVMMLR